MPESHPKLRTIFGIHIINLVATLAQSSVKCVTPRVRECVDMIETLLGSITNSGTLDIHISSHTFNEITYIDWTTMSNILFPLFHDILLTRDLNAGITIAHSISLPVSTLYSFCNATSSVTNSLVTCLQAIKNVHYREGPEYISPSAGGTTSHSDTWHPTSTFRNTWETPLWSPCYGVMVEVLKAFFRY